MYIPNNMEMTDSQAITDFIAQFGFALLVTPGLVATHLPLLFKAQEAEKGVLYGHMAAQNSQWQQTEGQRVLAIFSGPHAYISPQWYSVKPAVPTWNYAAVHCYGRFELLSDKEKAASLNELVEKYEPTLLHNESLMPSTFVQRLSLAIVGFRIRVDEIQAKEKLGQHRSKLDQLGVFSALSRSEHNDAIALAQYMQLRKLGVGD